MLKSPRNEEICIKSNEKYLGEEELKTSENITAKMCIRDRYVNNGV